MISSIPKSGIYYPNRVGWLYLRALEDELGRTGLTAVLNLAGFPEWIEQPPPDNLRRDLDLNVFSKINAALEEMYGPRSGRAIARRVGWDLFHHFRRAAPIRFFAYRLGTHLIPAGQRPSAILLDMSRYAGEFTDRSLMVQDDDELTLTVKFCPVCWGRKSSRVVCHLLCGLLEEGLNWLMPRKQMHIVQTSCSAMGDDHCTFRVEMGPVNDT